METGSREENAPKQESKTRSDSIGSGQALVRMSGSLNGFEIRSADKKRAGHRAPLQTLCRPYFSPENLDLILIDRVTLLLRDRAPPETWTTRLQPYGQPEIVTLDQVF
jgi:hypothetical protein